MKIALASVAAVAAALVAAAPSSAAVYFNDLGPITTLPMSYSPGFSNVAVGNDTFNITFSLSMAMAVNYSSFTSSPPAFSFASAGIYSGAFTTTAPTGTALFSTSTPDPVSRNGSTGISLDRAVLDAGTYTISVSGANNNAASGTGIGSSLTFSMAPEPASWGLMVIGFGAVGAALRTSRRKVVFA